MNDHDSFFDDAAPETAPGNPNKIRLQNLKNTFGKGAGRLAICAAAAFVVVGVALGARGLTSAHAENTVAHVDVPKVKVPRNTQAITPEEADNRLMVAAQEADAALQKRNSYVPGFDVNISSGDPRLGGVGRFEVPTTQQVSRQAPTATVPPPRAANYAQGMSSAEAVDKADQARIRSMAAELNRERGDRDKWVRDRQGKIIGIASSIFGSDGRRLNDDQGDYTVIAYSTGATSQTQAGAHSGGAGQGGEGSLALQRLSKVLIKTGTMFYATLDAEINTDDGADVIATIRGGSWDGSKLIGKLTKGNNNVGVLFSVMAPQDERPTMSINAVALREEDAKMGVAENIDRHLLGRYSALFVSSLVSGAGRVYQQAQGTTAYLGNGTIMQQTTSPDDRQVIGSAIGEVGTQIGQEIRKDFNKPTTYRTPAGHGLGIFFMTDVIASQR
jgi:intracellular multiplication protein IcmE